MQFQDETAKFLKETTTSRPKTNFVQAPFVFQNNFSSFDSTFTNSSSQLQSTQTQQIQSTTKPQIQSVQIQLQSHQTPQIQNIPKPQLQSVDPIQLQNVQTPQLQNVSTTLTPQFKFTQIPENPNITQR